MAIPEVPCDAASVLRIVEVCAGIGGIGVGAEQCSFAVHGSMDKNLFHAFASRLMLGYH